MAEQVVPVILVLQYYKCNIFLIKMQVPQSGYKKQS